MATTRRDLSKFRISETRSNLNGYNYYSYVHHKGAVIIMREKIDGTEILYANGRYDYTTSWTNKETLNYKRIDQI